MLQVLHPTYTFRVTITGDALKGGDWNGREGKTGCDEAWAKLKKALADAGLHADIMFEKFEHR
jgi:hypothetical protein